GYRTEDGCRTPVVAYHRETTNARRCGGPSERQRSYGRTSLGRKKFPLSQNSPPAPLTSCSHRTRHRRVAAAGRERGPTTDSMRCGNRVGTVRADRRRGTQPVKEGRL